MDVVSFGALRVNSLRWQPRQGAHALTVICKATFDLQPGKSPLSATQEPVWDAVGAASDMAPFKRRADVFVLGRAFPPKQTTVGVVVSLVARIGVGAFHKAVEVRADRGWIAEGLAPVAPTSPSRAALLGRHAMSWDHRTWSTRPLPEYVDGVFFNAAPVDQQLPELVGDERIVLEHLHPQHVRLETRLARVAPRMTVRRTGKEAEEARLRCDTLIIDTDRQLAMLVWRGAVLLAHAEEDGFVAVAVEGAKGDLRENLLDATTTLPAPMGESRAPAPALPFERTQGDRPSAPAEGLLSRGVSAPELETGAMDAAATTTLFADFNVQPVLPFMPGAPSSQSTEPRDDAARPAPLRPERSEDDGSTTMTLGSDSIATITLDPVTPFKQAELEAKLTETAPFAPAASKERSEVEPGGLVMPFDVPPPPLLGIVAKADTEAPSVAPEIEKPPMIGPLAREEKPVEAAPTREVVAPQEAPAVPPQPPEPELAESLELTLEQVAAIAAELAEGKQERAKVLKAHGLRERVWRENERRWVDAIEAESARGTHALRGAYDAAYVAKVEELRGPITLEEYSRIAVGLERGTANDVLDTLRIQRPALMPIVRLWARKLAKDMKLGDAAIAALRVARRA